MVAVYRPDLQLESNLRQLCSANLLSQSALGAVYVLISEEKGEMCIDESCRDTVYVLISEEKGESSIDDHAGTLLQLCVNPDPCCCMDLPLPSKHRGKQRKGCHIMRRPSGHSSPHTSWHKSFGGSGSLLHYDCCMRYCARLKHVKGLSQSHRAPSVTSFHL